MKTIEQRLKEIQIVPVIAINNVAHALPLAKVLVENGLPCAEVTFRTKAAAESIRIMRDAYPDLLIGAGTVLTTEQVDIAIDAGVDFIVSPGFNPTTVKYCQQRNMPIVPGVNNPSLVEQAMEMGLKTLKFFPAEPSGGVNMLKALSAVYPVSFMPTGGVSPANVDQYLALKSVVACGGTWMVPTDMMDNGDWDGIAALVKAVSDR
ncbi:bifunctional 4-hydroxy-2-oxoglutarate aldolase/2-dehydro-3-deoxy-phosphogluconate aldolase [Enterovibrio norvegicus]|uniref:2-dehydro-3-deoxy-phosphogluconate aldolase n=1 Tax=Enterovibrio norvegicus TaxID=188144 RepID=A0ABV4L4W0_9GAMM